MRNKLGRHLVFLCADCHRTPLPASSLLTSARLRSKNLPGQRDTSRREYSIDSIPPVILAPAVFGGLVVTLWTYKCLMMVVFQNKIIYMPGVPPFSRSEKVADYAILCKPVEWREVAIKASDGTTVKLLTGSLASNGGADPVEPDVVVLYFQG